MKCPNLSVVRYTWPGQDEAYVCAMHAQRLQNIAQAMGFNLQLIPLNYEQIDLPCSHNIQDNSQLPTSDRSDK